MNIDLKTLPHSQQRYDTVGDWWVKDGTLFIRVSEMNNWCWEMLVGIHEIVEAFLCLCHGIHQDEVTKFDVEYGKKPYATAYKDGIIEEPGDAPNAPYRNEHCFATGIERLLASILGIKWVEYEERIATIDELKAERPKRTEQRTKLLCEPDKSQLKKKGASRGGN